ncbi:MAG TPA: thioesterase [Flavobacteriales bacterium]|nr:thioesterase [Flavobacteriales bacterium]
MTQTHFQKLERMYLVANIQKLMFETTTINISEGEAEVGLTVQEKYHHAGAAMHGAVYFKLLDDAAYFAANSVIEDVFLLTSSFNVNLIRPVVSGKIRAIGKLKSQSKNLLIAEATIYNEEGKEVAFGTGTFMKSGVVLTPEIGYK